MAKTTIVSIHETGETDVLKFEKVDVPKPGGGELLVSIQAIGIGWGEVLYRRGLYVHKTILPSKMGNNAIATVQALGKGVEGHHVGDRVAIVPAFKMSDYGVYGEHAIVPARAAMPYFENMSLTENAALWVQYGTAYGGIIYNNEIKPEDTLLVIPASGGVGLAAMQIAKDVGATVIGVTRSRSKEQFVRDGGADHVIVTNEEDLKERVNNITGGKGARIIFNALTGDVVNDLVDVATPGGVVVLFGGIGLKPTPMPLVPMIAKGISVQGFTLYEITFTDDGLNKMKDFISGAVKRGSLRPLIDRTFPFERMGEAHEYIDAGSMTGSVVVLV